MSREKTKVIIFAILVFTAVLLLLLYVKSCGDDADTGQTGVKEFQNKNVSLSSGIDSILYSFAIKKSWIRNKNTKDSTLLFSKDVLIPNDLPAVELNYEITDYLGKRGFANKVTEEIKSGNLMMNIFFAGDTLRKEIANLKLTYSDSAKRNASSVCIVLDSIESLSLSDAKKILNSTQQFSVLLPLRNDKAEYQSEIIESNRSYIVEISIGNDDDIVADLKEGMSPDALKTKIRSLSLNFVSCSGYVLNVKNASGEFTKLVEEEFAKNNLPVYNESMFSSFHPGANKIISLFENVILQTGDGKKFLIYRLSLNTDEFNDFDSQVYNMKKLGYKFLNFRDFMKRQFNIDAKKDSTVKAK